MPFDNLSSDPEQDHFSDGLTEDIITALSRTDLFVLGRASSFQYKSEEVDLTAITEDLKVSYILNGSVRRDENYIRVSAQLVDMRTGRQMWGEQYNSDLTASGLFSVQDEITARVAGTIAGSHGIILRVAREQSQGKDTDELSAYGCVLRTYAYEESHVAPDHLLARECLEQAVTSNPNYADAKAHLSYIYREEYQHGFNEKPDALQRSVSLAREALAIDPNNQNAYYALALAHYGLHEVPEFLTSANRAIAINPNNSRIIGGLGVHIALAGEWQQGIDLVEKSMKLNPHSSNSKWLHFIIACDNYRDDQFALALREIERVQLPSVKLVSIVQIAIYHRTGDLEKAQSTLKPLLEANSEFVSDARSELEKFILSDADLIDDVLKWLDLQE